MSNARFGDTLLFVCFVFSRSDNSNRKRRPGRNKTANPTKNPAAAQKYLPKKSFALQSKLKQKFCERKTFYCTLKKLHYTLRIRHAVQLREPETPRARVKYEIYFNFCTHRNMCGIVGPALGVSFGGVAANMRPSRCLEQSLSIWGMLQTREKNAKRKKNWENSAPQLGKYSMTQIRAA